MRTKVVAVAVLVAVLAAAIVVGYVSRDLGRYEPGVARLEGYALGDTPTQLIVFFATGADDVVEGPLVNEDAAKVMVTVRTSVFVPGRGRFKNLSATLAGPRSRSASLLGTVRSSTPRPGASSPDS